MSDKLTTVIVVISPELGWDNVVRLYDAALVTMEEVKEYYKDDDYAFVTKQIHKEID